MVSYTVKQTRARLSSVLQRAASGEKIAITRRGKEIVHIQKAAHKANRLQSMKKFRATIIIRGRSASKTCAGLRDEER